MASLMRQMQIGVGFHKQTDITEAAIKADIWRLQKVNADFANVGWVTENDAEYFGKGHEFATELYRSHVAGGPHRLEKRLSSEFAAWLFAFGLGDVTPNGTTYTCKPIDPMEGLELPYFTYVEQIAPEASPPVRDVALVGCAVRSFTIAITSGPGTRNAMATVEFMHSGKIASPAIVLPDLMLAEHLLNAYSLTITINDVDYIDPDNNFVNFISAELGWDNAFREATDFYPGSGQQNAYQIRGRMEIGNRVPSFNFVARYAAASYELDKVRDLTATGVTELTLTNDVGKEELKVTWPAMAFSAAELGEQDGIVTVRVTGLPLYDEGIIEAVATCQIPGICAEPSQ